MMKSRQAPQTLRRVAMGAALLLIAAPAALADAPGYEFMYLDRAPPRRITNDATNAKTPEIARRSAEERRACAVVLGPNAADDRYAACISSLERSAFP
jgi:hypothetical protein